MTTHEPIAYTYEADTHCPACAEERFGRSPRGFIAEDATDNEGNPVGIIAPWDEWYNVGEGNQTLACSTCGEVIETYEETLSAPSEEDITANDPQGPFFYLGKQIAETRAELRAWMNAHKYWPDVWWISDHGNPHLMTIPKADTPRMIPGQEPYTPEELARLQSLVSDAAEGDPGETDEEGV